MRGCPWRPIAAAPFKPETLFADPMGDTLLGAELNYAPCVAGVCGRRTITAGLLASGLCSAEGNSLFLDIGTNGEMALVGGGKSLLLRRRLRPCL